jgi:transcriptional regulator with XRE-family HTH domain
MNQQPFAKLESAFGARVKEMRERQNLSQRKLSELVGERGVRLDPTAITRLEKEGERGIRLSEAAVIAAVLGIDLTEFIYEHSDPEERLMTLRAASDHNLNVARRFLQEALETLSEAQRLLAQHPELTNTVVHRLDDQPPTEPAAYLRWVVERLETWGAEGAPSYLDLPPKERRDLSAVARVLADSVMRPASQQESRPTSQRVRAQATK